MGLLRLAVVEIWAGPPAARRLFLFAGMRGWLLCMNVGLVCVTSSSFDLTAPCSGI